MDNRINTIKSMLQYAVNTLNTASGVRKRRLKGIYKGDGFYRVHMQSLSPYFIYDECMELVGRSVDIDDENYIIHFGDDLWFELRKLSS